MSVMKMKSSIPRAGCERSSRHRPGRLPCLRDASGGGARDQRWLKLTRFGGPQRAQQWAGDRRARRAALVANKGVA
eukprot:scaffold7219_cov540-Prasinococcus_capsulatus_cf.AAC.7